MRIGGARRLLSGYWLFREGLSVYNSRDRPGQSDVIDNDDIKINDIIIDELTFATASCKRSRIAQDAL